MEMVTIREASLRLHLPQSSIRQCVRDGELKAVRMPGPDSRPIWMVELPEEGWTSAATQVEMGREFSPWCWADNSKTGTIHYVERISVSAYEEIMPHLLCETECDNVWPANGFTAEQICPECLAGVEAKGLPMKLDGQ